MAKLSPALVKSISMALRFQYDQIIHEPLPDRWVDLIKYLDEKEKRRHRYFERYTLNLCDED